MPKPNFITVVSGLPRSGTSLMMQMLTAGGLTPVTDGQRTPDEDNPRGYLEFEGVKKLKTDKSWVPTARGGVVKLVHLLIMDLPLTEHYRVVFMRRHIEEVLKSQNVMLERQGKKGADLSFDELKNLYLRQIDTVQAYMKKHADRFEFVEVSYNRLIDDPAPVVLSLCEFLACGLDAGKMVAAVDPALYRNRRAARPS